MKYVQAGTGSFLYSIIFLVPDSKQMYTEHLAKGGTESGITICLKCKAEPWAPPALPVSKALALTSADKSRRKVGLPNHGYADLSEFKVSGQGPCLSTMVARTCGGWGMGTEVQNTGDLKHTRNVLKEVWLKTPLFQYE